MREFSQLFWLVCGNQGSNWGGICITRRLYDRTAAAGLPGNGFTGPDLEEGWGGAAKLAAPDHDRGLHDFLSMLYNIETDTRHLLHYTNRGLFRTFILCDKKGLLIIGFQQRF